VVALGDYKHQVNFAGNFTVHRRSSCASSGTARQPSHRALEKEFIAWNDLSTKSCLVDATKEWKSSRKTFIGEHC
jgi:hypothetical protein